MSSQAAAKTSAPRDSAAGPDRCRCARVRLAHLPTPLDPCPRLTAALGGPEIWIKRDDLTGLAFGGNKTRQLEFVFADILARGADTVVAGAYTQSNWCRQMTAAARKLGLEVSLVLLHGEKGPALQGNLLLDRLMGAEVTVVDLDSMERLAPLLEAKAEELARAGRKPYIVAPFALDRLALGAFGYVNAALELDRQFDEAGIDPDWLYLCGANMTPAGLALGLKALGRRARLINIAPIRWSEPRAADIARIASAAAERLGLDVRIGADEIANYDDYIGERYGVVTEGGREAHAAARPHRGDHSRPRLQQQGDGRSDRSHPPRPDRQGRDRGLPPYRRHARALRLRRRSRPQLRGSACCYSSLCLDRRLARAGKRLMYVNAPSLGAVSRCFRATMRGLDRRHDMTKKSGTDVTFRSTVGGATRRSVLITGAAGLRCRPRRRPSGRCSRPKSRKSAW